MSVDTSHYDCFTYKLTKEEIEKGEVHLDPYKVSSIWGLGGRDNSGCLFHILKNIARYGLKGGNTSVRERAGIKATIERLIQISDETSL